MTLSPIAVGLVVDDRVAEVVAVPESVVWRMARRAQSRALGLGVRGACRAEVHLLPQRSVPGLASGLEVRIAGAGGVYVAEIPTSALEPLLSGVAADLREAAGLHPEIAISYLVLRPRCDAQGPVWASTLPAFVTLPSEIAPHRALFPDRAWIEDVPILIDEGALRHCADACRDGMVERGGALLGHVCINENGAAGSRLFVRVAAFAEALGAEARATHLTFSAAAWGSIQRSRVAIETTLGLSHPLQVVGWAHGHPRLLETGGSPFFLSPQDVATTAQHFAEPFACALVLDAQAEPAASFESCVMAFGWDRHGISLVPRSLHLSERSLMQDSKEDCP